MALQNLTSPIFLVAPHPDDEFLGCYTQLPNVNKIIVVTNAEIGTVGRPFINQFEEYIKSKREGTLKLAEKFGVSVIFLNYQSFSLWELIRFNNPVIKNLLTDLSKHLEEAGTVYIPSFWDSCLDHKVLSFLCLLVLAKTNAKIIMYSTDGNIPNSTKVQLNAIPAMEKAKLFREFYKVQYKELEDTNFQFRWNKEEYLEVKS